MPDLKDSTQRTAYRGGFFVPGVVLQTGRQFGLAGTLVEWNRPSSWVKYQHMATAAEQFIAALGGAERH